jgi:hypothetical protein
VAGVLLRAMRMDAALALESVLGLTAALARDLQHEFLPLVPRVAAALADLVQEGRSGTAGRTFRLPKTLNPNPPPRWRTSCRKAGRERPGGRLDCPKP